MSINDNDRFPPEPVISGAHTLVRNGLMQNDMDAQGFRILHLDTSNLVIPGIPSQTAVVNKWFNSYDSGTKTFGILRPKFTNLEGDLSFTQQRAITKLGTIGEGVWNASQLVAAKVPRLNNIRGPDDSVVMLGERITHLGDPISDQDAVTLRVLNGRNTGTQPKAAVRCASVENMLLAGITHTVDGVTLADNDRVLVKNQTGSRHYQNGIWMAHPGAWTRTEDTDTAIELELCTTFVLEGDTNALTTWLETTELPFNIDFGDPAPYAEFALYAAGTIVQAGDGLDMIGNTIFAVGTANRILVDATIDIDPNYEGQDSITHVGTIDTGTWEGDIIDGAHGGTNRNNGAYGISVAGDFNTIISSDAPIGSYLTFTLQGSTSLILPTLGTVATLHGDETLTNKHIAASEIDSGVLLLTVGGTSANNAVDALNNLLPSQIGQAGKYLTTDGGGNISWATPSSTP